MRAAALPCAIDLLLNVAVKLQDATVQRLPKHFRYWYYRPADHALTPIWLLWSYRGDMNNTIDAVRIGSRIPRSTALAEFGVGG